MESNTLRTLLDDKWHGSLCMTLGLIIGTGIGNYQSSKIPRDGNGYSDYRIYENGPVYGPGSLKECAASLASVRPASNEKALEIASVPFNKKSTGNNKKNAIDQLATDICISVCVHLVNRNNFYTLHRAALKAALVLLNEVANVL